MHMQILCLAGDMLWLLGPQVGILVCSGLLYTVTFCFGVLCLFLVSRDLRYVMFVFLTYSVRVIIMTLIYTSS